MTKKTVLNIIGVYGVSHALVDATCVAILFAIGALDYASPQNLFLLIVLYNIIAFATQPILGLLVDLSKAPAYSAVVGMVLVAVAALLLPFPYLAAVMAGIGNALFHVGGGVISLSLAPGKAALPGLYVAPGALGLTIGLMVGKSGHFVAWPFMLLLIGSAILILRTPQPEMTTPRTSPANLRWFDMVIVLLLVSIAVRGMVGMSLVLPWKSDPVLLIVLTAAVVLGKALGGILGDRFGWAPVAVSGLVVSAPLLTLFAQTPAIAITGLFLFNLSMPVALVCLAEMLPGKSGFAFGLTAFALIVGAFPTFTPLRALAGHNLSIFAAIFVSIAALYAGLRLYFGASGTFRPDPALPDSA